MYIFKKNEKISYLFGGILLLLAALLILTGCSSDSGGDGGTQLETIEITVSNYEDFVTALEDNQHTMIVLANDIEGKNESLKISALNQTIIDFGGNNFKGDFDLQQPDNNTSWDLTFENGNITGDLTINDSKLSLTLNDNFNVEGQTNIENVAANTFLNKGEINALFINDNDGVRIVNEGTINGDIEIDADNPSADIKLAGTMSENNLKITGNSARVIIEKETIINNITVEADNTKIIIDTESDKINTVNVIAVDVEFEISQDFDENKIEGNETTVITKIENMISGYVNYAASMDDIKVGLITNESLNNVNTFNDLEFVVGPETVDVSGYYRFINLDTEIEFYVVAYKDLNNNGELDFFDSVDGINIGPKEPYGVYSSAAEDETKVNVGGNEILENMNIELSDPVPALITGEISNLNHPGNIEGVKVALINKDQINGISGLEMLVNRALKITELGGETKNRYVFWDVDPGEYIIFAYIEENEIGFYGNHLKGVNYTDLSEPLTEIDIDISDKYLRVAVGSTDVINETETALYDAEVTLYSSAGDILIEVDNLIEDNEGYAVTLLTGLETEKYYLSAEHYSYDWGSLSPIFDLNQVEDYYLDIFNNQNLELIFGEDIHTLGNKNLTLIAVEDDGEELVDKSVKIINNEAESYEFDSNYIGYLEANDSFSLDFSLSSFKHYLTMEDNGQVEEIFIAGIKGVEAGKYEVYLEEESKLEILIKEQMLTFIN